MSQILTLLETKKSRPVLLKPNVSIKKAASLFKEKHIRASVISHGGKHVDGLLTERDIVHGLVTMRDLVGVRLTQVQTDADVMRNYISNGG